MGDSSIYDLKFGYEYETIVYTREDKKNNEIKAEINRIANKDNWKYFNDKTVEWLSNNNNLWDLYPYEELKPLVPDESLKLNGTEITSPIIDYKDISKQLSFLTKLKTHPYLKFLHNTNTSGHVHISHKDIIIPFSNRPILGGKLIQEHDYKMLNKLLFAWLYFEAYFMILTHTNRRENAYSWPLSYSVYNNIYNVEPIHYYEKYKHFFINPYTTKEITYTDKIKDLLSRFYIFKKGEINNKPTENIMREMSLNLSDYYNYTYNTTIPYNVKAKLINTIEYRLMHGTNDVKRIEMWMKLLGLFTIASYNNEKHVHIFFETSVKERLFDMNWNTMLQAQKGLYTYFTNDTTSFADLQHYFNTFIMSGIRDNEKEEAQQVLTYWNNHLTNFIVSNDEDAKRTKTNTTIPFYGGTKMYKKTDLKKLINGRMRVIYRGNHNKQYVKIKQQFIPIAELR